MSFMWSGILYRQPQHSICTTPSPEPCIHICRGHGPVWLINTQNLGYFQIAYYSRIMCSTLCITIIHTKVSHKGGKAYLVYEQANYQTHTTVSVNRLSYIRTTSLQKIQVNNGQSVYKLFKLIKPIHSTSKPIWGTNYCCSQIDPFQIRDTKGKVMWYTDFTSHRELGTCTCSKSDDGNT